MWSVCSNFIITIVLFPSRLFCLQRDSPACVAVNDTPRSNPAFRCFKIRLMLLTLAISSAVEKKRKKHFQKVLRETDVISYKIYLHWLSCIKPTIFYYFDSTIHFVLPLVKTFEAAPQPSLLQARTINISSHMHSNMGLYIANKLRAAGGGVGIGAWKLESSCHATCVHLLCRRSAKRHSIIYKLEQQGDWFL